MLILMMNKMINKFGLKINSYWNNCLRTIFILLVWYDYFDIYYFTWYLDIFYLIPLYKNIYVMVSKIFILLNIFFLLSFDFCIYWFDMKSIYIHKI